MKRINNIHEILNTAEVNMYRTIEELKAWGDFHETSLEIAQIICRVANGSLQEMQRIWYKRLYRDPIVKRAMRLSDGRPLFWGGQRVDNNEGRSY